MLKKRKNSKGNEIEVSKFRQHHMTETISRIVDEHFDDVVKNLKQVKQQKRKVTIERNHLMSDVEIIKFSENQERARKIKQQLKKERQRKRKMKKEQTKRTNPKVRIKMKRNFFPKTTKKNKRKLSLVFQNLSFEQIKYNK